jgi:hypothetical protein
MTNLTTLTDDQLIQRAADYMNYLQAQKHYINLDQAILMDEMAGYFEDARMQTVDIAGYWHMVMKSNGLVSMRITVGAAVCANRN